MKEKELKFFQEIASDRIKQKQNRLDNLKLIYKFNSYSDFNYTKEEIEEKIKELENYIYIATH